jgi:hypothetical protein
MYIVPADIKSPFDSALVLLVALARGTVASPIALEYSYEEKSL